MNITPRKSEYEEIAELLESDEFESADALAKAIFKTVHHQLLDRDWFLYGMRWQGGTTVCWGPFSSEKEAERFAGKFALAGSDAVVNMAIPIFSVNRQLQIILENDKPAINPVCENCGHPKGIHEHERAVGRCQYRACRCNKLVIRKEN